MEGHAPLTRRRPSCGTAEDFLGCHAAPCAAALGRHLVGVELVGNPGRVKDMSSAHIAFMAQ